jgi:hypothetical protein
MQIVIDIPEGLKDVFENRNVTALDVEEIRGAIKSGTPLPEGCDIQCIIPKRVDIQKWIYTKCPNPNCNYNLSIHHGDGYYSIEDTPSFCPKCGQALLWEKEE